MPHKQSAFELIVAVAHDVGLHVDRLAKDSLDSETATVDFGRHAIDGNAALQMVRKFHAALFSKASAVGSR